MMQPARLSTNWRNYWVWAIQVDRSSTACPNLEMRMLCPFPFPGLKVENLPSASAVSSRRPSATSHSRGSSRCSRGAARDPKQVPSQVLDLLASYQKSIVDQLIDRLDQSLSGRQVRSIQLSGGVSCNSELRQRVRKHFEEEGIQVYYPSLDLTTDNAAMIAAAGVLRLRAGQRDDWDLQADPNLALYPILLTSAEEGK